MENDLIPSQKNQGEEQIPPRKKVDERILSLNKNDEDRTPPSNHTQTSALFTIQRKFITRNYKVYISFGLTMSRMRHSNCVFHTGAGPNILRENLIDPN